MYIDLFGKVKGQLGVVTFRQLPKEIQNFFLTDLPNKSLVLHSNV